MQGKEPMDSLVEAKVPNLRAGESAYQVDSTTVMAITVRRRQAPDEAFIAFGVSARLVDGATGESCRCVADTPLETPENTVSVPLDMIANGQVDLAEEIEDAKRRAIQRVLRLRAALESLHLLPEIEEE